MLNLRVLTYGGLNPPDRFDGLIARALARMEPRLNLVLDLERGEMGRVVLGCGAAYEGLRGDCFIVENTETGVFKVVDFQDSDWSPAVQLKDAPSFRGALYTMYQKQRVARIFGPRAPLVQPGWFLDHSPLMTQEYRAAVSAERRRPLIERLYFRGTILQHRTTETPYSWNGRAFRQVAVVLAEKYPDDVDISDVKLPRREWFLEAARHRAVLALPGHPWCYREFEMFNLGIPLIAYPWHTKFESGAMPEAGVHYVATADLPREEVGFALDPEEGADVIIAAFRAARSNHEWLEQVGLMGQLWYDRELTPEAVAAGVLAFLNLDGPEWHADYPRRGALAAVQSVEAV